MIGETIFNAVYVLSKTAKEIEAMISQLDILLEDNLKGNKIKKVYKGTYNEEHDETKWACIGMIKNYGLVPIGKKKPYAYLAIQVSLFTDEDQSVVKQPLLHVLFSGEGEFEYDEFTLNLENMSDDEYEYELKNNCLWEWHEIGKNQRKHREWNDRSWAFSIPLVNLNTVDDLKNNIVNPVKSLIDGKNQIEAFKLSDKILKFDTIEGQLVVIS